jgi:hypothetical protein
MRLRKAWAVFLALAAALALAGCGGGGGVWDPTVLPWIHDIEGTYQADDLVGDWGRVALQLERVNRSRLYNATLANPLFDFFRTRDGLGTLANDHLIINFDTGLDSDFYFEGDVIIENDTVLGLTGQFIFPDQAEPARPAVFSRL